MLGVDEYGEWWVQSRVFTAHRKEIPPILCAIIVRGEQWRSK
jgi:hypothetical protein